MNRPQRVLVNRAVLAGALLIAVSGCGSNGGSVGAGAGGAGGRSGSGGTAASGPLQIVAGPDGNIWFTESNAGRIGRFTP